MNSHRTILMSEEYRTLIKTAAEQSHYNELTVALIGEIGLRTGEAANSTPD